jgi:hypothetical protein
VQGQYISDGEKEKTDDNSYQMMNMLCASSTQSKVPKNMRKKEGVITKRNT